MASTYSRADRRHFDALGDEVGKLYGEGSYADALARIDAEADGLLPWRSDLAHLAACLHATSGDPRAALATLRAALTEGAWWDVRILTDDDGLVAVRELPGYAELAEESGRRCEAAHREEAPIPPVVLRPGTAPRGVLVALHGADQEAEDTAETWTAGTAAGFVVVAVTSSRRSTPTYRTWPDQAAAAADVRLALETLSDGERELPMVAGGFSAGGRAALLWALTADPRPVASVLLVAPAIDPDRLPAQRALIRGTVIVGADDDLADDVRATVEALSPAELTLDLVDGLDHAYPPDFADRLLRF
ncbi:MAG: phospholipase [Streptosporangiales bacterium]|nr:phospholipase [Streptosporangiales bacterium]